jgi:peroxiredoxin
MKNLKTWTAAGLAAMALITVAGATQVAGSQDKTKDKPAPAAQPKKEEPKKEEPMKDAKAAIGKPAPDFELKDLDGKVVKLSDYKGKVVVLEWFNPQCPVIMKSHAEGPLKDQAARVAKDGIVWLSINSSAAGKEGSALDANKKAKADWKMGNPILLDEKGEVGRKYDAKTTPHMFVIDAKGVLAYRGAIDNMANGKPDGDTIINYVDAALADIKAGKPVAHAETKSYGCSVKY